MSNDEFVAALIDKYEAWELVELLTLSTTDITDCFYELVISEKDFLMEELKYGCK